MGKFIDLTGQRFGRLIALERVGKRYTSALWKCQCDCGNVSIVPSNTLRDGRTNSCGCAQREWLRNEKPAATHHGTHERLYRVWLGMKERCSNPRHNRWGCYGGRGITVCEEWRNDYAAFRSWALANGYDPDALRGQCTIDRIDVNGPYSPENCRWVDMKTQISNKRKQEGMH